MIKLLFEGEPVAASRPRVTRRGARRNLKKEMESNVCNQKHSN